MKTVRAIAGLLYYLTRLTAILFLLTALYASVVVLLYNAGVKTVPMEIGDHNYFIIFFPFSKVPFLLGDYENSYLVISLLIVLLYGMFLWLLSTVFQAFRQQKLFVEKSVTRLKYFYLFNFLIPLIAILSLALAGQETKDAMIIVFLHEMIGVFAFFMATIFKQGLVLQEEQDLTL